MNVPKNWPTVLHTPTVTIQLVDTIAIVFLDIRRMALSAKVYHVFPFFHSLLLILFFQISTNVKNPIHAALMHTVITLMGVSLTIVILALKETALIAQVL